jgi:hypothetical protein
MGKRITEIPFLGILIDCFPNMEQEFYAMNESDITNEQWWFVAKWWRNALLNESDWSQAPDNALTASQRESWRQYRTELRDLSDNYADPKKIVFPDLPS